MKPRVTAPAVPPAFTLVEMLVVVAIMSVLAGLLLPTVTREPKSLTVQCLSNKRQAQLADLMYAGDNNDFLVPNSKTTGATHTGWLGNLRSQDWFNSDSNTNQAAYQAAMLGPYMGSDITAYRCPHDTIPSANGFRLRSISMNAQVGQAPTNHLNPGYLSYPKLNNGDCPADIWAFGDEAMWTMDDGRFEVSLTAPAFPSMPAAYDVRAGNFSFLDGHAETHKWRGTHIVNIAYRAGLTKTAGTVTLTSPSDPDWLWLKSHSAETN